MMNMDTNISLPARVVPAELVRWYNALDPEADPVGPDDTLDDIEVEVSFREGWFKAGRLSGPPEDCYPDEGEDPEVESITITAEGYEGPKDIDVRVLTADEYRSLVRECWSHQQAYERDYDPY